MFSAQKQHGVIKHVMIGQNKNFTRIGILYLPPSILVPPVSYPFS